MAKLQRTEALQRKRKTELRHFTYHFYKDTHQEKKQHNTKQ
jgi:hypothetical protein